MIVNILSGIPGSGKSTWTKREATLVVGSKSIHSADDWFMRGGAYNFDPTKLPEAHRACFKGFLSALNQGVDNVFVDNTNLEAWQISPYYMAAECFGYTVHVVRISCDVDVAARRNVHGVPHSAVVRMHRQFMRRNVLPWWNVSEVYQAVCETNAANEVSR